MGLAPANDKTCDQSAAGFVKPIHQQSLRDSVQGTSVAPRTRAKELAAISASDVYRSLHSLQRGSRDPDGHPLEILWFPSDKGNPKWHVPTAGLFLGIDHTAIVISETEASLKFYRDRLGMEVAGESENYGPEQERLNNVFGARLHITALRAASGPGIEFLEYLAPRDGRPFPPEEKANDLIHWQTRFLGISVDDAAQTLRNSRSAFVSPGAVALPDGKAGFRKAVTVRDPDGHAVQIVER